MVSPSWGQFCSLEESSDRALLRAGSSDAISGRRLGGAVHRRCQLRTRVPSVGGGALRAESSEVGAVRASGSSSPLTSCHFTSGMSRGEWFPSEGDTAATDPPAPGRVLEHVLVGTASHRSVPLHTEELGPGRDITTVGTDHGVGDQVRYRVSVAQLFGCITNSGDPLQDRSTTAPGYRERPTLVASHRCGTWKPRHGPAGMTQPAGRPTVRRVEVRGGTGRPRSEWRQPKGNRKARTGDRTLPMRSCSYNWPHTSRNGWARKGADMSRVAV
jgi:hypothetical protein